MVHLVILVLQEGLQTEIIIRHHQYSQIHIELIDYRLIIAKVVLQLQGYLQFNN